MCGIGCVKFGALILRSSEQPAAISWQEAASLWRHPFRTSCERRLQVSTRSGPANTGSSATKGIRGDRRAGEKRIKERQEDQSFHIIFTQPSSYQRSVTHCTRKPTKIAPVAPSVSDIDCKKSISGCHHSPMDNGPCFSLVLSRLAPSSIYLMRKKSTRMPMMRQSS